MEITKNSTLLASFIGYCQAHPYERFWQALRNWSGHTFILVTCSRMTDGPQDTFYLETKHVKHKHIEPKSDLC